MMVLPWLHDEHEKATVAVHRRAEPETGDASPLIAAPVLTDGHATGRTRPAKEHLHSYHSGFAWAGFALPFTLSNEMKDSFTSSASLRGATRLMAQTPDVCWLLCQQRVPCFSWTWNSTSLGCTLTGLTVVGALGKVPCESCVSGLKTLNLPTPRRLGGTVAGAEPRSWRQGFEQR